MTIWITGADGFIGRHLAARLSAEGKPILGLGHRSSGVRSSDFTHLDGDCDFALFDEAARFSGLPRTVYHLAGGGSVGTSFGAPFEDFRRTVGATAALVEWLRREAPGTALVFVSSAAIYGDGHAGVIGEKAPARPFSPYGAHKFAAEHLCRSAAENFGIDVAIVRPFSIYGSGLTKQLLWDSCRKLATDPTMLELGGTGREMRDWLHVSDLCALLARLEGHGGGMLTVNAGSGAGTPVADVAALLIEAWGEGTCLHFSGARRAGDPASLIADVTLASQLGFAPTVGLSDGIRDYVAWFKRRANDWRA